MQQYPTKMDAVQYFESIRWGDHTVCTKCGCDTKITPQTKFPGRYWCGECRGYFTALTGTPMEYGKVDPRKWIFAAYLLMTARKGISAMQLSKELEVHYSTAWYMLHRIRMACGDNMEALYDEVEMDATYLGGKESNKHESKRMNAGRGTVGKQAVMGVRQRGGRTRAVAVDVENSETVLWLAEELVDPDATIYSDEAAAYNILGRSGYRHKRVNHSAREYVNEQASTNGVESVWAVLKRGYNGVYHNWSKKHCQKYIDEFVFRLNEGNCERDTQDRLDDLFRGMAGKTITYAALTA